MIQVQDEDKLTELNQIYNRYRLITCIFTALAVLTFTLWHTIVGIGVSAVMLSGAVTLLNLLISIKLEKIGIKNTIDSCFTLLGALDLTITGFSVDLSSVENGIYSAINIYVLTGLAVGVTLVVLHFILYIYYYTKSQHKIIG